MKNFRFDNRSRNRRDSPRRNSGGRDSRRFSLHNAVCDECGKDCQVPFKPSNEKPIYCSDCFERKGGRGRNRSSRSDSRKRNFDNRDSSRHPQNNISGRSISQLVEKIGTLNTKLETIINLLSSSREKKSKLIKVGAEKNKKSKSIKVDKITEALATIKDKDTALTVDNAQENIISKPKKTVKSTIDSQPKIKPKTEGKHHPIYESKARKKPQSDQTANLDNQSSGDKNTEKKEEFQLEAKAKSDENSKKPIIKS